jgi:hypothetical protein
MSSRNRSPAQEVHPWSFHAPAARRQLVDGVDRLGCALAVAPAARSAIWRTLFMYDNYLSADFAAGSFIGFRFGDGVNWNCGWIEVTWNWTGDPQTSTFQILGAGPLSRHVGYGVDRHRRPLHRPSRILPPRFASLGDGRDR